MVPTLRNLNLEAAIADDNSSWLVYSDWFEERGHTHQATAMRVLGGREPKSALERDASRLVSLVNLWIQDEPDPEAFMSGDIADTRVLSSDELRDRRPRENLEAWLTLFFEVWGETSPFETDDTLATEFDRQTIPAVLLLPSNVRFENLLFDHVVVGRNGATGVNGCLFLGDYPREHAAELVYVRLGGAYSGTLDGLERKNPDPNVTIYRWHAMSRANFFAQVFSWRASNDRGELQRAGRPQPLMPLFKELGPLLEGASASGGAETHGVARFENAWLTFSAMG